MSTPNSSNPSIQPVHGKHNRQSAYMAARIAVSVLKLRIFIALFAIIIVFSLAAENFLSAGNMLIMAKHVTIVAILSIGMTLVILTGGIDLSVGSIVGISGMAAGYLLLEGVKLGHYVVFFNPWGVTLIACALGAVIGAVNGYLITALNVAPFIATLGMLYVVRGAALLVNNGGTFADLGGNPALGNTGFEFLGNGTILGLSMPVWIMVILAAVTIFIAKRTPLGIAAFPSTLANRARRTARPQDPLGSRRGSGRLCVNAAPRRPEPPARTVIICGFAAWQRHPTTPWHDRPQAKPGTSHR